MPNPISILIVEDERIISIDIANTLKRMGYGVAGEASRGEDALKIAAEKMPDLILMDILLKGEMDGIECASIINEKYKIPVIFITAHQDNATIEKTKLTNPYGFISKPLDDKDLNICIKNAMYRHESETKYWEIKEKYFRLTENAKDMIYRYSITNKCFEYVNTSSVNITGYLPAEFYNNPSLCLGFINLPQNPGDRAELECELQNESEYAVVLKDGKSKWLNKRSVIICDDSSKPIAIEGIVSDISDRKAFEEKLKDANKKLHSLAGYIENIREEERQKISREIHDQLGADLSVMKVDLYLLCKKLLKDETLTDKNEISDEFRQLGDKVDDTINKIRRISSDLRPDVLDRLGLIEAIEWQLAEFEKRTNIKCNLINSIPELEFTEKISVQIFRILQELLTNVIRHAKADRLEIELGINEGSLVMSFTDNGIGITAEQIEGKTSLGIMGLKERVYLQDGEIDIHGLPGKGTAIKIRIPIEFKI
jgi:PAS domain S-box-containing protein